MNLKDKLTKSAPARKGKAALNRVPRLIRRLQASDADYATHPPIIVNSLPKSGTHLMMQLADALPGVVNYGTFLAQTPSLTLKERSRAQIDARIAALAPGEVVGAHLYYSPETAAAFAKRNALHLFIWRDPRDVILSEAHYLAEMARFHAMHATFKKISDPEARVKLALTGDGTSRYPDAHARVAPYLGWCDDPQAVVMRYERAIHPKTQAGEVARVVAAFVKQGGEVADQAILTQSLVQAVAPKHSHTFHKGGVARWMQEMSTSNQALAKDIMPSLIALAQADPIPGQSTEEQA